MNLNFYKWMAGSMSDFTKPFQENEQLYNQAKGFWRHLDGSMPFVFAIFVMLGIALAAFYYKPYNEQPGRHYKPSRWGVFLVFTFVLTIVVTFVLEYIFVKPVLRGAAMLEMKIALCNAIYASITYLGISWVWCKWLPTNAYRLLKF